MATKIRGNSQIMEGTIENAQLAIAAAIATSKLADGADFLQRDGSVALTGNLNADGNTITGLAAPSAPSDAVNKSALDAAISALSSGLEYKGVFDASSGSFPTDITTGDFYKVSVAGTVDGMSLAVGDMIIANNDQAGATEAADWDKIDNTESVTSVAGKTGAVTLTTTDITDVTASAAEINLTEGMTEVSDDTTMADDSSTAFVTEHAAKTYTDNAISGLPTDVYGESLAVTNGSPTPAALANSPVAGTVRVYLNGVRQTPGDDYNITGSQITFTYNLKTTPGQTDVVLVDYIY